MSPFRASKIFLRIVAISLLFFFVYQAYSTLKVKATKLQKPNEKTLDTIVTISTGEAQVILKNQKETAGSALDSKKQDKLSRDENYGGGEDFGDAEDYE